MPYFDKEDWIFTPEVRQILDEFSNELETLQKTKRLKTVELHRNSTIAMIMKSFNLEQKEALQILGND